MKQLFLIFLLLLFSKNYSQDYFKGKKTYCEPKTERAQDLFKSGIKILHLNSQLNPEYLEKNRMVFFEAIKEDSTFCDAYFFVGYTSRLLNNFELAFPYYYMADSLAVKPALEFKQNLAITAMASDAWDFARLKYSEIKTNFPDNPEGYYGIAVTSLMIGDYEEGVANATTAMRMYNSQKDDKITDARFIKAVLLTLLEEYETAIPLFEQSRSRFKKDENYKIHYSLALLKVSEQMKNEKMKNNAKKIYDSIEDKSMIPENLVPLYKF
jgi:tetratricopeptide (TPR) repeat protein